MKFDKYYILPIFATGLLFITLIINKYRLELLGIRPGYAPHNFAFNISFFFPSILLSLICAIIVLFRKPNIEIRNAKFYSILLVAPILILWILQIIIMAIVTSY